MTQHSFGEALNGAWGAATRAAAAQPGPETTSVFARVRRRRRAAVARLGAVALVAAGAAAFGGVSLAGAFATVPPPGASPSPTATSASPTPSSTGPEDPRAGIPVNFLIVIARAGTQGDAHLNSLEAASIVHISADRTRVEVIPVTLWSQMHVDGCATTDGTEFRGQDALLSFAYSEGFAHGTTASGIDCTAHAIEANTGVAIDGAVLLDAAGLATITDGVGGADVCLAEPAVMADWGVDLAPGENRLDGESLAAIIRPYFDHATFTVSPAESVRVEREARAYAGLLRSLLENGTFGSREKMADFEDGLASRATETGIAADHEAIVALAYSLRDLDADSMMAVGAPINLPEPTVGDTSDASLRARAQLITEAWHEGFARIVRDEAPAGAVVWPRSTC